VTPPLSERSEAASAPSAVPQGRPENADGDAAAPLVEVRRLELRHISKSFGGVRVLRDVNFHLAAGEVVGLLGDNGAGKSTLIKLITGVHQPDEGEILFGGQAVSALDVQQARALGVETVYQERALAEQLPLWRNIFLGRPISGRLGFLKVGEMRRITSDLMGESMGFTSAALTPDTSVIGLSGGERQGLAIVRALHFEADIIILDEPTMGLSLKETEKLLHFVDGIRDAGKSCIFIDHNIFHVYSVADRIVVLDRGHVAGEFPTSRYSLEELINIMKEVAVTGAYAELDRYRPITDPVEPASDRPMPT
jgi:simple sugar transport system ATP-binding protein